MNRKRYWCGVVVLALSVAACSGDGPPPLPNPSSDHTTVVTTPQVLAPTFDPAVPIAPAVTTTGPDLAVPTVGPDVPVDQPVVDVPSVPESGTATPIDGDPVVAPTPTPTPTPNPNPNPNPDPIPHPNPPPTPDPIPPPPPPPPPPTTRLKGGPSLPLFFFFFSPGASTPLASMTPEYKPRSIPSWW